MVDEKVIITEIERLKQESDGYGKMFLNKVIAFINTLPTEKDKVEQIKEAVNKLKNELPKNRGYKRNAYNHVLAIIESMQEEPKEFKPVRKIEPMGKLKEMLDNLDQKELEETRKEMEEELEISELIHEGSWESMEIEYDKLVALDVLYKICHVLGKGGKGKLVIIKED